MSHFHRLSVTIIFDFAINSFSRLISLFSLLNPLLKKVEEIVMKKFTLLLLILALAIVTSCENPLAPIQSFTASKGTYVGLIHLAIEQVADAENYNIQRRNPVTNEWEEIYWGSSNFYQDHGWGLENGLIEGQLYEYRARAHKNDGGYNDWSEVTTGYIFSPSLKLKYLNYYKENPNDYSYKLEYLIIDKLPKVLHNLERRRIELWRSESINFISKEQILSADLSAETKDSIIAGTEYVSNYNPNKTYYYKLIAKYDYDCYWWNNGAMVHDPYQQYTKESSVINGNDITEPGGGGTAEYNVTDYGEINSAATNAKDGTIMCSDGSTVYLGYFDNYSALAGIGKPVIMKNDGANWQNAFSSLRSDLDSDNTIEEFDFTVSSNVIYLAALGSEDLYVYKYNGAWSQNLSTSVLWGTSKPNYLNIAVLNNELYLTIKQNDDIKVFKYGVNDWTQVGGNVATGFNTNTKLKNLGDKLYIWYEANTQGSSSTILHIKHLEGSSWINDFESSKDATQNFELIKVGNALYFKYDISGAEGNVCKVTSTTSATNLVDGVNGLFSPKSITSDASGNIIISCITGTSLNDIHQEVWVYESSEWKTINDDYSGTSFRKNCSSVQALNNDIHFVYGLKSSEDALYYPTILKAKKYSK